MTELKKVFISYSWDSEEHINWVAKLAQDIEIQEGFHVIWDGYDLDSCVDKNLFMEESVYKADFTVVVATQNYLSKANKREGGVGIETFLNANRHWEEMLANKKTNSIVVVREKDSTPLYLKGHFHLNFVEDVDYPKKIAELLQLLNERPRFKRPQKIALPADVKVYNLTKAAEIIHIGTRNRKQVIELSEGTDFSGGNRIKFEVWETTTPAIVHILALHNNINIGQTLSRAAEVLISKDVAISHLMVLRPKEKRKNSESLESIFNDKKSHYLDGAILTELTYEEYIWNYCIDESFKTVKSPDTIDFYTTQELNDGENSYDSAVSHLIKVLTNDVSCSPQLVIGGGGIGKTSLCLSLVKSLVQNHSSKILTVLIRSEDIRKYLEAGDVAPGQIESIYDIYELQAKYLKHSNLFDKKTFELSIVSGNIAIVVDGLDELSSIFKEKFNIKSFLKSIESLHEELGYGRILLTSRDNSLISQDDLEEMSIKSYALLGFKIENCRKYLKKRFARFDDVSQICEKIISKVEADLLFGESRIVPFFVDVISNIYEENIASSEEGFEFDVRFDETPYPSLNELIDHVIYSVFEREKTRHKFDMQPGEMVDLFCYLNQECGEVWLAKDVQELLSGLYGSKGDDLYEYIKKNPLIKPFDDSLKFKYDFLNSYFNSLTLFNSFIRSDSSDVFAKTLSRVGSDAVEFKDITRFFSLDAQSFLDNSREIVDGFRKKLVSLEGGAASESIGFKLAIENIVSLIHYVRKTKKEDFTSDIKYLYGVTQNQIDYLYIKGDLPAFDFSEMSVSKSRFKNYQKFLGSNFEGASFIYSEFEGCHNDSFRNSEFLKAKIDRDSCVLGDLADTYVMLGNSAEANAKLLIDDSIKFLGCFYKGSSFRDNNKVHMRFSNHVPGLKRRVFHKLISNGYFRVSSQKEVDTFYEIEDAFKASVRRFINDGYKDYRLKSFLKFVQE